MSDSEDLPSFLRDVGGDSDKPTASPPPPAKASSPSPHVEVSRAAPVDEPGATPASNHTIHQTVATAVIATHESIKAPNPEKSPTRQSNTPPRSEGSFSSYDAEDPDFETAPRAASQPKRVAKVSKPKVHPIDYRQAEKNTVAANANSLLGQALAIRQRQLKKAGVSSDRAKDASRKVSTPSPLKTQSLIEQQPRSSTAIDQYNDGETPSAKLALSRPKYPYLSPQNLLKHEQGQQEERIRRKTDRERIEHNRLMNLALAREREAKLQRDRQEAALQLTEQAHQSEMEEPSYAKFPTIHSENSVAPWSRLQDKVWRPSGRLTKKKAEQLSALGYTSSAPRKEPNNNVTLRNNYGCVTDGGTEPSGVASLKSEPHQVTDFDPGKFERITLQRKQERESKEKEEKWSHIRLVQKKRSECVSKIEARKRDEQEYRSKEQEAALALSRAGLIAEMESKKEQIAQQKEIERQRREQVLRAKEIRQKEVMERALQVRMEVLEDAAKQSSFDYDMKSDELGTRESHRQALLKALGEQRKKHQEEQLAEELLRHEVQIRDQQYAADQERQRVVRREEKLSRVRRNRDDAVRNHEKQKIAKLEVQMESDWMYDTLLKKKALGVASFTRKTPSPSDNIHLLPPQKELAAYQRHNEKFSLTIEKDLQSVNAQQRNLEQKKSRL